MKPIGVCCTDGSGLWTVVQATVRIVKLDIAYLDDDHLLEASFGELRAHFPVDDWDWDNDGLIYTDKRWMREFRKLLVKIGFSARAAENVDYSEQGMQGRDYVSMDVGDSFLIECDKLLHFTQGGKPLKVEIGLSALE